MSEWGIIKRSGGRGGEEEEACLGSYVYISACPCVCVCTWVCLCVALKGEKRQTDRCLAQLYTPNGACAMIVSMKGGSDLHHLCSFYFSVLLESDTDTQICPPHHHHTHRSKCEVEQTGILPVHKSKHDPVDKITFLKKFYLAIFCSVYNL